MFVFFFKLKTAYEMRISDWSSDVCSSDLIKDMIHISHGPVGCGQYSWAARRNYYIGTTGIDTFVTMQFTSDFQEKDRSEEHTSELQSLMRISYAVFCLQEKQ